uniref:HMA domain-containing protein n=2 Tax=Leersia perrieri TaxID=77586 RepID=A0A0D9W6T8_9ORYZ
MAMNYGVMDEDNASSDTNSITLDLRVYMHCDACERSVRRTIKSIDGVEKVEVDREENKVTVTATGDFEAENLVKKIKKKTGKKAEILEPEEDQHDEQDLDHPHWMHPNAQAHEFQRLGMGHYVYVPCNYAPCPCYYDRDRVGGAEVSHQFWRHSDYAPCYASSSYYDPVHPYNGGRGADVQANEFQKPHRDWDLHCFDDENTEACRLQFQKDGNSSVPQRWKCATLHRCPIILLVTNTDV